MMQNSHHLPSQAYLVSSFLATVPEAQRRGLPVIGLPTDTEWPAFGTCSCRGHEMGQEEEGQVTTTQGGQQLLHEYIQISPFPSLATMLPSEFNFSTVLPT